jgi:hypothetical protein
MRLSQKFNGNTAEEPASTYRAGGLWQQPLWNVQNDRESKLGSDGREPFTTIDDLVQKAQELFSGLKKLSEFKHPLDVRRGIRKGVVKSMNDDRESRQVNGSGRTYFLDKETTKEGKPYLKITESRKGEKKFQRNSIYVFPEDADEFAQAVSEMTSKLG